VGEEREVALRKPDDLGWRVGFSADDDQAPGDVVGAVAVFAADGGVPRVLEHAGVVAEPYQVLQWRIGTARSGAAVSMTGLTVIPRP
jgi:hypothetical protein